MATTPIADIATSVGGRIGRHFSVVSMLPALFLTLWVYLLIAGGAATGAPHFAKLSHAFGLRQAAWLVLAALAVGLLLHPLQYPVTQLLEGYWGVSPFANVAATARVCHHRQRQRFLQESGFDARKAWVAVCDPAAEPDEPSDLAYHVLRGKTGDPAMAFYLYEQEADRLGGRYPPAADRILPTRLGNVLRRFEETAGSRYGLDIVQIAPHLSVLAASEQRAYVRDAREEMDAAIGLCIASLLATIASVGFLFTDRAWLLVSLLPYALAYIAYRGAVAAAEEYGTALSIMVDLSRFALYEQLRLLPPATLKQERDNNTRLRAILDGREPQRTVRYRHPATGSSGPASDRPAK